MCATSRNRELAPERLNRLRALLREQPVLRLADICRRLNVSPATARRDLNALERQGELRRVHGGAVGTESRLEEPLFDDKATWAAREKNAIARTALRRIQPGDTLYLDGGSTVLALARLLRDRTGLTVVTNSLRAAIELAGSGPRLILIGGELRRLSQTLVGPLTRLTLDHLHVDRAFMGTIGLTLDEGLTTTDTNEAFTKELVLRRAREVVLLADASKFGAISNVRAGRLEDLDLIITHRPPPQLLRDQRRKGVKVVLA